MNKARESAAGDEAAEDKRVVGILVDYLASPSAVDRQWATDGTPLEQPVSVLVDFWHRYIEEAPLSG